MRICDCVVLRMCEGTIVQMLTYLNVRRLNVQMCECTIVRICETMNIGMFECTNGIMCEYGNMRMS